MGHLMFAYGVMPCVKPVAFLNPSFHRDLPIVPITVPKRSIRVCVWLCVWACVWLCVCVCTPQPPLQTSLPSFPFSFTPSQLCSLTHSQPGQKTGRAAPQSGTPVLKLTQAAGTLLPIQGASFQACGGDMEMVRQAIHSLPQYGLSDLLSSHQGNYI